LDPVLGIIGGRGIEPDRFISNDFNLKVQVSQVRIFIHYSVNTPSWGAFFKANGHHGFEGLSERLLHGPVELGVPFCIFLLIRCKTFLLRRERPNTLRQVSIARARIGLVWIKY
jgi:hypothetical protein